VAEGRVVVEVVVLVVVVMVVVVMAVAAPRVQMKKKWRAYYSPKSPATYASLPRY
jgi:predicted RND superfamily exporter protein